MIKSISLSPAQLVLLCQAQTSRTTYCCAEIIIPLADLKLGVSLPERGVVNPDEILLPFCPTHKGGVYLIRVWGDVPENSTGRGQVLAINALAQYLKAQGQVDAGCAAAISAETGTPVLVATLPLANVAIPPYFIMG